MCGIAGFSLISVLQDSQKLLHTMAAPLNHRGPDGEGVYVHNTNPNTTTLGLTHKRLSIIDVAGGAQPLITDNKQSALVLNGELYNYKSLQDKVTALGSTLQSGSDCEPLLHLFTHQHKAAFEHIEGMYAFALYKAETDELWLGRDPFGIKPLYYCENAMGFAFASEPRALIAGGFIRPEVNEDKLGETLNFHYSSGRETLFSGIYRVLPGERLCVRKGRITERYIKAPVLSPAVKDSREIPEAVADFHTRLISSVERHLQADVPFGLLLSGGLDSSALALTMQQLGVPIHAYTANFAMAGGHKAADESQIAAALCEKIGAQHTTVTYSEDDFWHGLIDMAWAMDDLMTDYASLPLLKIMARAKQDVKILLSGEGGDELLAGYKRYFAPWWKRLIKRRPRGDAELHAALFQNPALFTPAAAKSAKAAAPQGFTRLQAKQAADITGWLPHDLLHKLDRTSMAHHIEGRVPFLDDHLAPWLFKRPDAQKVHQSQQTGGKKLGKWLLRQHLFNQGQHLLALGKKQGFSVPVGAYLAAKQPQLLALWQRCPLLQKHLKPAAAETLLSKLSHNKTANLCFSLTVLCLWHKLHIEGQTTDALKQQLLSA